MLGHVLPFCSFYFPVLSGSGAECPSALELVVMRHSWRSVGSFDKSHTSIAMEDRLLSSSEISG